MVNKCEFASEGMSLFQRREFTRLRTERFFLGIGFGNEEAHTEGQRGDPSDNFKLSHEAIS